MDSFGQTQGLDFVSEPASPKNVSYWTLENDALSCAGSSSELHRWFQEGLIHSHTLVALSLDPQVVCQSRWRLTSELPASAVEVTI